MTKRKAGMTKRKVGMAKRKVGMAKRKVGMAKRKVGMAFDLQAQENPDIRCATACSRQLPIVRKIVGHVPRDRLSQQQGY
jgi:hypothetical protein